MAITGVADRTGAFSIYPADDRKNTKKDVENEINRLEKQKDLYKKQRENSENKMLDMKIEDLEKKIGNLQQRLKKMRPTGERDDGKCETCENRRYQDGSNDPGVSFKTASKISGNAEAAVRGHEYEHVNRNQAKAAREDKEVVYQSVTLNRAICPNVENPMFRAERRLPLLRTSRTAVLMWGWRSSGEKREICWTLWLD